MISGGPETYAVITADDFGTSQTINHAITEAHDRGILTAASIVAGGSEFDEAVRLAKKRSRLSPGLHVMLCDGRAVLSKADIPDLVDAAGRLEKSPARAWIRYSNPDVRRQLDAEIEAQFARLEQVGIHPRHVDGHHHLHMHPAIFSLVCKQASRHGVRWVRIPYEPFRFVARFRNPERGIMPFLEWGVFGLLRSLNAKKANACGLHAPNRSYGLSRAGGIDKPFLLDLFKKCNGGLLELFTHPDSITERGRIELDALTSSELKYNLAGRNIRLVGFQELLAVNN
jgi:hopanoid biosynthesis associated protein HpnK